MNVLMLRMLSELSLSLESQIQFYRYEDLQAYTDNFNTKPLDLGGRLLGKGGYGEVFFGTW